MTTTESTITAFLSATAPHRLRVGLSTAKFATLRISKDGRRIRDGRIYQTENGMRANRGSRPSEAQMFTVSYLGKGFYALTEIA
jgi:hypothetical protein